MTNPTINTAIRVYEYVKEKKQANPTEIVKELNINHKSILPSIYLLESFELIKIIRSGRLKILQLNKEVDVSSLFTQTKPDQEQEQVKEVVEEKQPEKKGFFAVFKK